MRPVKIVAAVAPSLSALSASAESARLGVSFGALEQGAKEIYLRYESARHFGPFRFAVGGSYSTDRQVWVGGGLLIEQTLGRSPFFVQASVLPGYYDRGRGKYLGGNFQIRSAIDVGYGFANGARLSVGIDHRSNAATNRRNPGLNAVQVRYAIPLSR